MRHPALLLAALLLAAPLQAQELRVLGEHRIEGSSAGVAFEGTLTITPKATYTCQRTYRDGRVQRSRGTLRVVKKSLVFTPTSGSALRFERADTKRQVRWEHRAGSDYVLLPMGKKETRAELLSRTLGREGALRFLSENNRGVVDPLAKREIQRSRQPEPKDVAEFKRAGGRTILSLNGDQDRDHTYKPQGEPERKVKLGAFIREQGLGHAWVGMSASRAPTDAELVKVFRVLLDERQRPVLMHCKGGADRTGVIGALYQIEFLGVSKERAKKAMRKHMWMASRGTEIQGVYVDLYQKGHLRRLLKQAGVAIPERFAERSTPHKPRWF